MVIFKDRQSAGKILAKHLKDTKADLVLAIPRGGVVVAAEIAKTLKLSLDIVITRKIGSPNQSELAIGAIDPDGEVIWDHKLIQDLGLKIQDLGELIEREKQEIKRRERLYRGDKKPINLENKSAILVDDGIATGATIISAIKFLKINGVKIIVVAAPVCSKESFEKLDKLVNPVICLSVPVDLESIGTYYQNFEPVTDQEVINLLK